MIFVLFFFIVQKYITHSSPRVIEQMLGRFHWKFMANRNNH